MRGHSGDLQAVLNILREIEVLKEAREDEFDRPLIQRGVTQCIINIAETAKLLSDAFRDKTADAVPWKKIMHTRDIAAHHYDVVDMDIVKEILRTSIPELEAALRRELSAMRPEE